MNGIAALIVILFILILYFSYKTFNKDSGIWAIITFILSILIIVYSGKSIKNANDIKENPDKDVPSLLFTNRNASFGLGVFSLIIGILLCAPAGLFGLIHLVGYSKKF